MDGVRRICQVTFTIDILCGETYFFHSISISKNRYHDNCSKITLGSYHVFELYARGCGVDREDGKQGPNALSVLKVDDDFESK
jgi:hypothetical protein